MPPESPGFARTGTERLSGRIMPPIRKAALKRQMRGKSGGSGKYGRFDRREGMAGAREADCMTERRSMGLKDLAEWKRDALRHYGHREQWSVTHPETSMLGWWKTEEFFENLGMMEDLLANQKAMPGKIRIIIDYDPGYPTSLCKFLSMGPSHYAGDSAFPDSGGEDG